MPQTPIQSASPSSLHARRLGDEFFNEPRRNLYTLALGFVVIVAAILTMIYFSVEHHSLTNALPILILMIIWALIMGIHLLRRKRSNPVLRLEKSRLRYFGGMILAPRLISIDYDEIKSIEKGRNGSSVRLRLKDKGRVRTIPIGMLPPIERDRFVASLKERV